MPEERKYVEELPEQVEETTVIKDGHPKNMTKKTSQNQREER